MSGMSSDLKYMLYQCPANVDAVWLVNSLHLILPFHLLIQFWVIFCLLFFRAGVPGGGGELVSSLLNQTNYYELSDLIWLQMLFWTASLAWNLISGFPRTIDLNSNNLHLTHLSKYSQSLPQSSWLGPHWRSVPLPPECHRVLRLSDIHLWAPPVRVSCQCLNSLHLQYTLTCSFRPTLHHPCTGQAGPSSCCSET